MKRINIPILLGLLLFYGACNSDKFTVTSPSGKNSITLHLNESGQLFYSIRSHGVSVVLDSRMGFNVAKDSLEFNEGLKFENVIKSNIDQTYHLPTGKRSEYINKFVQKTFIFKNKEGRNLSVICRAYNDGIAFRYILKLPGRITITKENTMFNIPDSTVAWAMNYHSHYPDYEWFYQKQLLDTSSNKDLAYPALVHIKDSIWLLLTEALVYNQPGTHLYKPGNKNEFKSALPQKSFTVQGEWKSPWRVFIIGSKLGTIVESTLVENLNPPSQIMDMSWIKPGVVVFPWWGNYMANSYIDTLKSYVDLAAAMNWEWIEFDVALVGSPLRTSKIWEKTGWLSEFIAYASSKGISVYGWDEWKALNSPKKRAYIFGKYKDLGIKGIKIDYINSDDADAMRFRDSAMGDAAKYHLMVSFHGATIPRGQRRKWPNVMTVEAVRGAEYYTFKNAKPPPNPVYNCILPFTRNVVGPMDYTPCTFTIRPENSRVTTYAHELALPIIFESGWTCMADYPSSYLNSPAKYILKKIKTTWDEIRFIDGYPGKFICIARRNGHDWYLAAINANQSRTLNIPLNFIKMGHYNIKIYEDDPRNPLTNVKIRKVSINRNDTLHISLAKNGGFCTIIENAY